jgi:hypothetical protein
MQYFVNRPSGALITCYCETGRPTTPLYVKDGGLGFPEVYSERQWNKDIKGLREERVPKDVLTKQDELDRKVFDELRAEWMMEPGHEEMPPPLFHPPTHIRTTGRCANPRCRKFFDLRSPVPLTDDNPFHIRLTTDITIRSPHVQFSKNNGFGNRALHAEWVDWIPSPRGSQRLTLDIRQQDIEERCGFMTWSGDAVRLGVLPGEFPDWRDDGTEDEFSIWSQSVRKTVAAKWEAVLGESIFGMPRLAQEDGLKRFAENLKPQVILGCKTRTEEVRRKLQISVPVA